MCAASTASPCCSISLPKSHASTKNGRDFSGDPPELIERPALDTQWTDPSDTYKRALAQYRERRALIESHIWGTFIATNKPTEDLTAINDDIALTIEASLQLGDVNLLANDMAWLEYLLMSYRLSTTWIEEYVMVYHQAAKIHLGEPAGAIVDWLANLMRSQERLSIS